MNFCVLGSDSFSGFHMVEFLRKKGDLVLPLGRWADINKNLSGMLNILREAKPDYIINFIAKGRVEQSWQSPQEWIQTNFLSTTMLIDGLKDMKLKRYVHVSTPEVCGSGVHDEDSPYNPSTPYAVTKAAMEMMLKAYWKAYGFPVVFTRSANVYGPGQMDRIIPIAMKEARLGRSIPLTGNGESKRSFVHIKDVCAAMRLIAEKGENGQTYNIANEEPIRIRDVVIRLGAQYAAVPERLGHDHIYHLKTEKIKSLGWEPKFTLDEGLNELWAAR